VQFARAVVCAIVRSGFRDTETSGLKLFQMHNTKCRSTFNESDRAVCGRHRGKSGRRPDHRRNRHSRQTQTTNYFADLLTFAGGLTQRAITEHDFQSLSCHIYQFNISNNLQFSSTDICLLSHPSDHMTTGGVTKSCSGRSGCSGPN